MATEVKHFILSEILESITESSERRISITIPRFQRNLVWTDSQRKLFIDSLRNKYPFGSLLLYKKDNDNAFEGYSLIDGLQRVSTIKKYQEKPTRFFEKEHISDELSREFILRASSLIDDEKTIDSIKLVIHNWVTKLRSFEETDDFSSYKLVTTVNKELDLSMNLDTVDELVDKCKLFVSEVKRNADISNVQIPAIIYYGDESNLAEIFERINSKGTKLNKYQIFAATWNIPFNIINQDIIEMIKMRYDKALSQGLEVEDYDPETIYTSKFTLFEYLFGLGKLLNNKYPQLLGKFDDDKIDFTDSIAFNLMTICCKLPINRMSSLQNKVLQYELTELEEAIIDSVETVYNILRPYLSLKANRKGRGRADEGIVIYHTEHQLVSYFGTIFHLKYDEQLNVRSSWKVNEKILTTNLPMYYLYDILREAWRGPVDQKLKETVLIDNIEDNSRYLKRITKESWDSTLEQWFETQLSRSEEKRTNIKSSDILFLKYIYTHIFTNHQNYSTIYEIEHLFPILRLKKATQTEGGLPMSCVANLALLEKEINREKKEQTILEYLDIQLENKHITTAQYDNTRDKLEKSLFIRLEQLTIPEDRLGNDQLTKDFYFKFLRERFNILKEKFISLNNIS
ncbi:DUF262 domain-containing protein [Priestia megaterium]|uniref:DUF262 domain-containing protein n=1 Tax=Priestia megaterium TaxID=1404 RepID=UPI00101BF503|nr:DUF262 domain-containing protein [Priestia megaterium]